MAFHPNPSPPAMPLITHLTRVNKLEMNLMNPGSDLYEEVAQVYARLVENDCPDAAAAIHQIHTTAGAHAALRAALVIKLLKMEVQQNHYLPNLGIYAYLFQDFPEAAGLLDQAIAGCLQAWDILGVHVQLQNGNRPQVLG